MPYRFEFLQPKHNRSTFRCGNKALDAYFSLQVNQDIRKLVAKCVVLVDESDGTVAGYYTLSSAEIVLSELPADLAKRIPYSAVPAVRIGRLAVAQSHQGKKLGAALIVDALKKVKFSPVAAYAVLVDSKDSNSTGFYMHMGFTPFESKPDTLYLPIGSLEKLFNP